MTTEKDSRARGKYKGHEPRVNPVRWLLSLDRDDWLPRKLCKGMDPNVFAPSGPAEKRRVIADIALRTCWQCSVRRECALEAIRLGVAHGIVGGVDLGDYSSKFEQTDDDERLLRAVANGMTHEEWKIEHRARITARGRGRPKAIHRAPENTKESA